MRGRIFAGAVVCAALLCGCSAADEAVTGEEIEVVMEELDLYEARNDPATPGGPVTVCTVGGVTMHCCPNWQAGRNHYVMTGVNLATNTFRCARLRADKAIHFQAVTLAPTRTLLTDGAAFLPACPNGQAMVGLHFDLKRAACTPVDGGGLPLITYTSSFLLPNGMRHCGQSFGDTSMGSFMWGIGLNDPNRLLCKH